MPAGFYTPPETLDPYKKLFLYGPAKSVKTPLALAYGAYLRKLNPKAKTLYIAADQGSEDLPSLPDESWREWIRVWTHSSPLEQNYNPYNDAVLVAMTDWRKIDPEIELIVWDTQTEDMTKILQFIADMEWFSSAKTGDKHVTIGDPTLPKGHPARLNIPVQGDFNAILGMGIRITNFMLAQKCHVLLVCHEEEIKDQKGVKRIGPAFVGKALTGKLPGKLTGLVYTEKFGETDEKGKLKPQLYVCSDPADDVHIAGVRHKPVNGNPVNPIPRVKVGNDLVKYWELFFNTLFPTGSK